MSHRVEEKILYRNPLLVFQKKFRCGNFFGLKNIFLGKFRLPRRNSAFKVYLRFKTEIPRKVNFRNKKIKVDNNSNTGFFGGSINNSLKSLNWAESAENWAESAEKFDWTESGRSGQKKLLAQLKKVYFFHACKGVISCNNQ